MWVWEGHGTCRHEGGARHASVGGGTGHAGMGGRGAGMLMRAQAGEGHFLPKGAPLRCQCERPGPMWKSTMWYQLKLPFHLKVAGFLELPRV